MQRQITDAEILFIKKIGLETNDIEELIKKTRTSNVNMNDEKINNIIHKIRHNYKNNKSIYEKMKIEDMPDEINKKMIGGLCDWTNKIIYDSFVRNEI